MKETVLNLIKQEDYATLQIKFNKMHTATVANILGELEFEQLIKIFRILKKDTAARVFAFLPIDLQKDIISHLSFKEAGSIVDELFADDAADLLDEMPASMVTRILANATAETRRDINNLLKYDEETAGSKMTVEFVSFKKNIKVSDAILKIKKEGVDKETINNCYVVDESRHLLGSVPIRSLLLNSDDTKVADIMVNQEVYVTTSQNIEEVATIFKNYGIITLPVVDMEKRIVGIITVDDILEIYDQASTEDIHKMAAIMGEDIPYTEASVFSLWKKRIPWLLILMISAAFTGAIISHYEKALAAYVILTTFIPMFMDTAGNAGNQTSVTVIRSIALGEIDFKDYFKILRKEFSVAFFCGLTLAAANFLKIILIDHVSMTIAFVVCITLLITVICAKVVGCSLPMVAKKLGADPAVMATPFITTIVDGIALVVFFQIATMMLGI